MSAPSFPLRAANAARADAPVHVAARPRISRVVVALLALAVIPCMAGTVLAVRVVRTLLAHDSLASAATSAATSAAASGAASGVAQRFLDAPAPVLLHVVAMIPFALLGALQFAPALRRQGWHARVGRLLLPCGVVTAVTGLWMAATFPRPDTDDVALTAMRLAVGLWMLFTLWRATQALVVRRYAVHGAWMTRAYAIAMGAGTQVLTHVPLFLVMGTPRGLPRTIAMGGAWLINAAVAEYVVRTRRVA